MPESAIAIVVGAAAAALSGVLVFKARVGSRRNLGAYLLPTTLLLAGLIVLAGAALLMLE